MFWEEHSATRGHQTNNLAPEPRIPKLRCDKDGCPMPLLTDHPTAPRRRHSRFLNFDTHLRLEDCPPASCGPLDGVNCRLTLEYTPRCIFLSRRRRKAKWRTNAK